MKKLTILGIACLILMLTAMPFIGCAEPTPPPPPGAPTVITPTPAVVIPSPTPAAPAAPVTPTPAPVTPVGPVAPVTPMPAPVVVTAPSGEPTYTVMDPRSYVKPIDYVGLSAPRLTTVDGMRVICVNTHGGNEDASRSIAPALQAAYPNCIVTHHEGSGMWRFEKEEEAWMIDNFDAAIIAENY